MRYTAEELRTCSDTEFLKRVKYMKKIYQSLKECPISEVFERQDTASLNETALGPSEGNVSKSPLRAEETPTFPSQKIKLNA